VPGVKSSGERRIFWSSAEALEEEVSGTQFPGFPDSGRKVGRTFSPRNMPQAETHGCRPAGVGA
jgi:hypothetical protein